MFFVWLGIIVLLTMIELMTVGLTTIWFVVSGIVALLLSFIIEDFLIQFAVFVILGIVLLITTRPILLKLLIKEKEKTNIDRIVGMKGIVIKEVNKDEEGEVKVDGKVWRAYSNDSIKKDAIIKVLKINGTKLKIEESE